MISFVLSLVGCAADAPPGDEIASSCSALVNAIESDAYLGLSAAEASATVGLRWPATAEQDEAVCTGVVVGGREVVTAAHCLESAGSREAEVLVDPPVACGTAPPASRVKAVHPHLDLAILEVVGLEALPAVEPIAANTEALDDSWLGRALLLVGFGSSGLSGPGRREFLVEPVNAVDAETLTVDGRGVSGACQGDSGGPLLARGPSGVPVVLGVLTAGSGSCTEKDRYVRLDVAQDWIQENVTAWTPLLSCGAIDETGRCYAGLRVSCVAEQITAELCGERMFCGWARSGGFACLERAESDCGVLDQLGACEGLRAGYCDRGVLVERQCGGEHPACQRSPHTGVVSCPE